MRAANWSYRSLWTDGLAHPAFGAIAFFARDVLISTKDANFGSYTKFEIVPSLIFSTASSITNSGTRNHSRGTTGYPKRSLISMSSRAGSNTRWISFSSWTLLIIRGAGPIGRFRRCLDDASLVVYALVR